MEKNYLIKLTQPVKGRLIYIVFLLIAFAGCKKFVETEAPKNQINSQLVYTNDQTAISAIRGIYSEMMGFYSPFSGDVNSISILAATSADEFMNLASDPDRIMFHTNSLISTNGTVLASLWTPLYKFIYFSNSVIEGLENSTGLSDNVKRQLEGEAKFIRAFCHFYLAVLFGDIPIVTSTDYRINNVLNRSSIKVVYQQIISDLLNAQDMLSEDYSFSNSERIRPNKWAAIALLARVYLYNQDWSKAESKASQIIGNSALYELSTDLNMIFLKNSTEAVWQLKPVVPDVNTNEARTFKPGFNGGVVAITDELANAFEVGDNRWKWWIDSTIYNNTLLFYPYKYKIQLTEQPLTEYSMVLRLAEQYLIRAEARARQDNILGAQSDINVIRSRAGLSNTSASDKSSLLLAIEQERRIELFSEWGHRWFDLKRMDRADVALGSLKGSNWQQIDELYPIPQEEINNNPNLTQNPGY